MPFRSPQPSRVETRLTQRKIALCQYFNPLTPRGLRLKSLLFKFFSRLNFNPLNPRGLRPKLQVKQQKQENFNPLNPRRLRLRREDIEVIQLNFNPLNPRGLRRFTIQQRMILFIFQSPQPSRVETYLVSKHFKGNKISIPSTLAG